MARARSPSSPKPVTMSICTSRAITSRSTASAASRLRSRYTSTTPRARDRSDAIWLIGLCAARAAGSTMAMAYPAVLSVVQKEWGLSSTAAGSISSAYQIGTAVALVFVSALADYLDPRLLFRVSAGLTAAVSLLIPVLAHGHLSALLLFGAAAVAVAGIYTPAIMLLAERFEPARRGRAMGWFLAASSMGYVLALVVGGAVVARAGWRPALFVLALGPLLCFALSLALFSGERSRRTG